jgi:uncharacterized membrane protein
LRTPLLKYWERVHDSFWFFPGAMVLLGAGIASTMLYLDASLGSTTWRPTVLVYGGSAEGARQLLATVAQTMLTAAAMVFSVMVVVLTLASQQFGPRLIRNFTSDTGHQLVLGNFLGVYVYAIIVLAEVVELPQQTFVPRLAITVSMAWAATSFGMLIYFVHHMSRSIKADNIIARVSDDLTNEIRHMYPQGTGREPLAHGEQEAPTPEEALAAVVRAPRDGYIETIAVEEVFEVASRHDLLVKLPHRPGQFVLAGETLALAWPMERLDSKSLGKLTRAVSISSRRTPTQDLEYAVHQLVEVAMHALSPSLNDAFTAVVCVDEATKALRELAQRPAPSPLRFDAGGRLRLIVRTYTFGKIARAFFDPLRQNGASSVVLVVRMLDALGSLGPQVPRDEDRRELLNHARHIKEAAVRQPLLEIDAQTIAERFELARRALVE